MIVSLAGYPVPLLWLLGGVAVLVGIAALLLLQEAGSRELEMRVASLTGEIRPTTGRGSDVPSIGGWLAGGLQALGHTVRENTRLYSEQDIAALGALIAASGLNQNQFLPVALGAKVAMMVLIPIAGITYSVLTGLPTGWAVVVSAVSLMLGVLAPEWVLRFLRRPYQRDLQRGASDALDLLVVCAESGMALESALETVARELRSSNRAIAMALMTLVDELKVLPDRRQAFLNFGQRSGVEALKRMSAIIAQSLQYGTPLGQALRAVSAELRRDRMTKLEAKAVRLPAMLVFPLIAFILPTLFIALMGPGMLRVLDTLKSTGMTH